MRKIIKRLILIFIILGSYFLFFLIESDSSQGLKTFDIKAGQGVNEISNNLKEAGLIKNKFVLETYLWLANSENRVKAGRYRVTKGTSTLNIIKLILAGPQESQTAITIPEGFDRRLIGKELEANSLSSSLFLDLTKEKDNYVSQFTFLEDAPQKASLEGYLFPDTYYINAQTNENDFILKTLNNFNNKLRTELREEIEKQGQSIFAVISLASIIEREVPQDEDKKMIADIFLKRLKINMALQSDATINFITGKGMVQPTYKDLEIDSLYNTYKYFGLPPGPIANPGLSSIEAVIYPISNNYYFFLTTKEGEVIYSIDYDEHLENKAKYLN